MTNQDRQLKLAAKKNYFKKTMSYNKWYDNPKTK